MFVARFWCSCCYVAIKNILKMLKPISDLPPHLAGIHAFGKVSDREYERQLIQMIDQLLERKSKINFILVLETDIMNFASGAWCGSVRIGLKYFFKWNKVAIVTDQRGVLGYSDLFKYVLPGHFKRFPLENLDAAIIWASAK